MRDGIILTHEQLYQDMKNGKIEKVVMHGYNDEKYIYELTKIEKNGRTYKLEGND